MKALRFHAAKDLRLEDIPEPPAPGPGQVLIRNRYVGICGTDLHEYAHGPIFIPTAPHPYTGAVAPQVLGHEFGGEVLAVGEGVSKVAPGDRVSVQPLIMPRGGEKARGLAGQAVATAGEIATRLGLPSAPSEAEALAGIALCQMITPGLPVVYGSFMTNLDLQSGATVFGSPESQLTLLALAQLARRYQLPFRSGGTFTSAKLSDAQAGYEATQVMSATAMGQVNFVLHAAGWLESGLAAGYEKFILDCEVLGMVHAWARGIDLSDEAFALDALEEVPPGGHFLGTDHTMRNFRTAFYRGEMFDYNAYEQWLINGGLDARQRANARWKAQLAAYEAPPLDPSIDVQLQEFMRARKRELGFEA